MDAAFRDACQRYRVVGLYADPSGWQATLTAWEQAYSRRLKVRATDQHPMHWWVNRGSLMVKALAAFEEAVSNGDLTHGGTFRLTEHILNARRNPSMRVGLQIAKEYPDSPLQDRRRRSRHPRLAMPPRCSIRGPRSVRRPCSHHHARLAR